MEALEKEFAAPELWSLLSALAYLSPSKTNTVCLFGTKAAGLYSVVWCCTSRNCPARWLTSLVKGNSAAGGGEEHKVRSQENTRKTPGASVSENPLKEA